MRWYADLAGLLVAIVGILASLFAFAKWVTEPRIRRIVEDTIAPITLRVTQIENESLICKTSCLSRIGAVETTQKGVEASIERIGAEIRDGMKDLAASIRELAEKHALTAEEVAEIRGRLDTPPRAPRPARRKRS